MEIPPLPYAGASPLPSLSPQQLQEMADARIAMKPIRRAIFAANFDGWSLAVFAFLSLICGFSSITGILIGVGLGTVAFVELRGISGLRKFEPKTARTLGYNQLALAGILVLYAAWNLIFPPSLSKELQSASPDLKAALGGYDLNSINTQINYVIYFTLIAVAVFAQGSLAIFYFRREKTIREYLANTPPWIVQMQRAGFRL